MVLQVSFGDEPLTTDLAIVVSPPHVRLHVDIKVALLSKAASTDLTAERLDPEVLANVNVKSGLLRVADKAEVAVVGLD